MSTSLDRVWRTDIDGLRGLAVLLVVGFHAGVPALRGAFVAVDVFFVLSGFFLATTITRRLVTGDDVNLPDLYARRASRLLPAMVVVLLATLMMSQFLYAPIDRAEVADHMQPVSLFAGNLAFAANGVNYFSAVENPFLHTWTLGVEYQLALLLPAIVMLFAAFAARRVAGEPGHVRRLAVLRTVFVGIGVLGALSFAFSVWISETSPMWAYFGPHTRLWSFCAGAALALVVGGGQSLVGASVRRVTVMQVVGLAMVFGPAFFFNRTMPYPGWIALAPVGGVLLLIAGGGVATETVPGRLLSSAPLASIGRVSYTWYLWHWPLMVLGGVLVPGIGVVGKLAWGAVGLGLAMVTQRWIEMPLHARVVPMLTPRRTLVYAGGACVAMLAVAQMAAMGNRNFVGRTVHRTFAQARGDRVQHECWGNSAADIRTKECALGDARASTTIALLGDSHADHWVGGLDRAGKENGWRIEPHVMGGCPVADLTGLIDGAVARRHRKCTRYREAAVTHLIAQKPSAVILANSDYYMNAGAGLRAGYTVPERAWTEGMRRTYARLARAGIAVIVIRGTPWVPFDVPSCLSRREARLLFATNCSFEVDGAFIARARSAQDAAARGLPVRFVDMNDHVCGAGRCAAVRGGTVMYTDDNHLTASYSRSLGSALGARISAVVAAPPGTKPHLTAHARRALDAAVQPLLEKRLFQLSSHH
jgi:peptidoglycan/LPS O-acetylase OafA/YrhL